MTTPVSSHQSGEDGHERGEDGQARGGPEAVVSGARLTWRERVGLAKRTFAAAKTDDVPSLAAGVAFKIFLSLFPAIIAAFALFALFTSGAELQALLTRLAQVAPAQVMEIIRSPLDSLVSANENGAGGAAVAGILGGMWAASSAAVTLMKALSRAHDVEETRKFVRQRVTALVITAALFASLAVILVLLVFGAQLEELVLDQLPLATGVEETVGWLVTAGRLLAVVAVMVVLLAFVYWIGPDRRPRPAWRWISAGAVLGVVGWLALSALFSLYTATFGNYGEASAYGAVIGGVIVLLLWLQLSMVALLLGGELNAELDKLHRPQPAPE
jgi:membrane protein